MNPDISGPDFVFPEAGYGGFDEYRKIDYSFPDSDNGTPVDIDFIVDRFMLDD